MGGLWSGYEEPAPAPLPSAGWYPDPGGLGLRYWDGHNWTQHFAPPPGQPYIATYAPPAPVGESGADGTATIVVAGYVTAVLVPIVGLILGIIATARRDEHRTNRHGPWIIAASIAAGLIWYALIHAAQQSAGYY